MMDPHKLNRKIDLMRNEAQAYIAAQQQDFDAAFASNAWLTPKKKKDFEKTLRSGDDTAGFQAVLTAGGRRAAMLWWMGRRLLHAGDDPAQGWNCLHRGLDAVWWGFLCRPHTYMDLESNIQLLIAWFDMTGVPQRADYIGRYLAGLSDIPDREKYLEHSDIGKLMTQLWCKDKSVDIDRAHGLYAFHRNEHQYSEIVENVFTDDIASFSSLLESALQYRVESSTTENGEFRTAVAFHLIPIEFQYIERIRQKRNLTTRLPDSSLFASAANLLPPPYPGLSSEMDPVLFAAIKKAVEQAWLDRKTVDAMM